jgi:hypothetical protein
VAVGIVLAAGLLVATRTRVTSLRYDLRDERKQQLALREAVEKLHVATGALSAPERLEPRALALGLTYPAPGQVITLPAASTASVSDVASVADVASGAGAAIGAAP